MSDKKTAIIIGAGVGGLATAVRLAKSGYNVKVFEKNSSPGGRCGQIIREGHKFDLGATIYLMPSIYREVFDSIGLKIEECIKSKPLSVIYRLFFSDGLIFDFTTDKDSMQSQIEKIEPGSYNKLLAYVSKGYELFQLSYRELLGRNFFTLFEFINFRNIGLLFKIKTHIKHKNYIKKFFKDPHLQVAFTFQNIYVGQNPFKAPALFAMLPAAELTEGSVAPAGGMYSIVETLVSTAVNLGVEFHYNEPVTKISVNNKRAESIILEDGSEIKADLIIANADLPYVYRELLPDKLKSRHIDNLKYSCSAITFHWALDKVYTELGNHSVFVSGNYRESLDKIFKESSMADDPSFYVHTPIAYDLDSAPAGHDSVSVIIPVGHLNPRKEQDWNNLKQVARTSVIERLKKQGLEDFEEHIKFEISYVPKTWDVNCNISKGSVFGSINHSILQMGYFRPHNRHGRYKNLYFVGGSTQPGNGVPLVLLSSKLTSERILKDVKNY
jgi:phytoene desaturase